VLLLERYRPVREATDWRAAAMYLQSCGYATDPNYGAIITRLIDQYALYKFDVLPVPFPDVPLGHWATGPLRRLKDAGILKGDEGTGVFRGDQSPTRYEMVASLDALLRYFEGV